MAYHERNAFRDRASEKRRTEDFGTTYRPFANEFGTEDVPRRRRDSSYIHTCVECGKRNRSERMTLPTGWLNTKVGIVCNECSDGYEPFVTDEKH